MKSIMIFVFFISIFCANSQGNPSFFVKILDKKNVPVITHASNGIRKAYSKTNNSKLDKLLNTYKIYNCKKVFKSSKKALLENIYLIECDDLQLMNDLRDKFKSNYPIVERAEGIPLIYPNDYGSTGGYTGLGSSQEDLDFIRASEAWDITTGSSDIKIGIADTQFAVNHLDLVNTISVINPNQNTNPYEAGTAAHGTQVSGLAAAETDNGIGIASIGYDSFIYAGAGTNVSILSDLSLYPEVKVLNASWYSHTTLDGVPSSSRNSEKIAIDEIINDRKKVLIAAAGNGEGSGTNNPNEYYFPASYKDVISVSSIGHRNFLRTNIWLFETFLDEHEFIGGGGRLSHQHNDSIDIVAPGYGVHTTSPTLDNDSYNWTMTGTSFAAPMVSGTVALLFDVNYCIDPKEVETILKLTAVKIDHLPQNIQYYGKLGAGKLDAYEAVKMAKDMADAFGTVEVKNRILYRPWFYKLETAPYEIKMINNDVTGGSKLKFKARNNIEILSGDYHPDTGGYIDLSIDATLALDCPPPPNVNGFSKKSDTKVPNIYENSDLSIYPNPTTGILNIINKEDINAISISDITGKIVYSIRDINSNEFKVNMTEFNSGMYFVEIKIRADEIITQKIIKK